MLAGVARPSPERVYTGSEDGRHHAAVMAGDGALVRAREQASDRGLYVQRVAAPGAGSDFSAWTRLDSASLECNIALCAHGATVLLFFVDNYDGRTIYVRESGDNRGELGRRPDGGGPFRRRGALAGGGLQRIRDRGAVLRRIRLACVRQEAGRPAVEHVPNLDERPVRRDRPGVRLHPGLGPGRRGGRSGPADPGCGPASTATGETRHRTRGLRCGP